MSNTINSQISANISTPLVFKEEETVSLSEETLSLIGTSQKGPAFVPQHITSFEKSDNILNTWENVFGDFDSQSTSYGPIAAKTWLDSGKSQLSYTRVLGSPESSNVGFVVGDNILSGSSTYGVKGSNPYSNTGGENGRTCFLGTIVKNKNTTGYISPHKNYLEQLNILGANGKTVCFVTDVIMMSSGTSLYLQNNDVDNINIITKKKTLATKSNSELAFVGSTVSSSSLPMIYVQGLKNDSKNVLDYYYDGNIDKRFELDDINSDLEQILYRGHVSYAKFRNLSYVDKPNEDNTLKHLVMSGSSGWNSGTSNFENFQSSFKKAKTPWIVSQPINREGLTDFDKEKLNTKCKKLFRFFTYDDGASGNRFRFRIKPKRKGSLNAESVLEKWSSFDIELYEIKNNNFVLLEDFKNLNLNPNSENYICNIIGTEHSIYNINTKKIENKGFYRKNNNYIYVEVHNDVENEICSSDLIPSGFMPYPRLNINQANLSHVTNKDSSSNIVIGSLVVLQNPLKHVANHLFVYNENDKNFKFKERYWGILFDKVSVKKIENVTIGGQLKKIIFDTYAEGLDTDYTNYHDYTKYFKNDYTDESNNIWIEDLEDNDLDLTNSFFHLEKILYPYTEENIKSMWNFSFYQRDGLSVVKILDTDESLYKYVNIDDMLASNTLDDSAHAKFLHFDLMTYGGFDGLNSLDDFKRDKHNLSILREYDKEIPDRTTGQTYDAYDLAADIVFNDGNIRSDVFCMPGISHIALLKKLVQRSNDEQILYIGDFPEYGYNSSTENENYENFEGLIKDPYFYKNINNAPDNYSDERSDIQCFINQGVDTTLNKFKEIYFLSEYSFMTLNTINAAINNEIRLQIPSSIFVINAIASKEVNESLDSGTIENPEFLSYNTVLNRNFIYNNNKFDRLLVDIKKFDSCINPTGVMISGNSIQLLSSNSLNKNNKSIMKLYHNVRTKQAIIRELRDLLTVQPIFQGNSALFSNDGQGQSVFNLKVAIDLALRDFFESYVERGIIKNYSIHVDVGNLNSSTKRNNLNNTLQGSVSFTFFDPGPDRLVRLDLNNLINNIKQFTDSNDISIINTTI